MTKDRKLKGSICKTIPCEVYSDRIVVNFIYETNQIRSVENFIKFLDRYEGKFISFMEIEKSILDHFLDPRFTRFVLKTIKRFYNLNKPLPSNFELGTSNEFKTFEDIRQKFYDWLNHRYHGFMLRHLRGEILREFTKVHNISLDLLNMAISYIDAQGFILQKAKEFTVEDFIGLLNYYLITGVVSKCSSLSIKLGGELGKVAKKLIYQAKKLGVLDFAALSKNKDGVRLDFELRVFEYAGTKIALNSNKLAYLIATLLSTKEADWVVDCRIHYGKDLLFLLRKRSPWLPTVRTPKEIEAWVSSPFDSALEENIFRELKRLLAEYVVERESDVIFLENGGVMIPDFTIFCGKKKIFVEVIGYWREKYLEKKREKLRNIPKDIKLILLLTERNWPLLETNLPKIKVTSKGSIEEKWSKILREIVDSVCS